MKVLHAGNMVNLAYLFTKHLRLKDIDAELLMEKNPPLVGDPRKFDFTLNEKFPSWIYFYDKQNTSWKFEIIKKMREKKYDLIHSYVELPIFSYLSRKPFIAQTQGSDFRELAFTNSLKGFLLRRAYKKAKLVLLGQADHTKLISKLKLNNCIFFPYLWDTDFFVPKKIDHKLVEGKFVIFHPTRQDWNGKKNHILIKGFAKFVKNNSDAVLVMLNFGPDSNKTNELILKLGIKNNVKIINQRLDKNTLLEYYNRSDVVADQFGISGSIGATALEAMSCKKPILISVDNELHDKIYHDKIPAMQVINPTDVSNELEILKDAKKRNEVGEKSRDWVLRNHSPDVVIGKLKMIYENIMNDTKIDEIRGKLRTM